MPLVNSDARSVRSSATDHPAYVAFITTRLLLFAACYVCLTLFPVHTILPWQADAFPGNNWLNGWVRWDAMWYESLVDSHARFLPPNFSSANFFPLYSCVSWIASLPFRAFLGHESAFYIGGLVVSHAAFLTGLVGVHRIATTLAGRAVAARTVWLIALFPFSFFFSAVYSDALYFCLAVWCFYFARAKRWRFACTLAACAAATRLPGFAIFPALVIEYLRQHDFRLESLRRELVAGAILAVAPMAVAAYFTLRYGHPLAFVHARQVGWQRATGLASLATDWHEFTAGSLLACGNVADCLRGWDMTRKLLGYWYVSLLGASVLLTYGAARMLGPGLCAWVFVSILMALGNGFDGMGRFTLVLFPIFIALATILCSRARFSAACVFFVPFLLLFLFQFARWRPVL